MARVIHPVDQPLDEAGDSNATLLPEHTLEWPMSKSPIRPLSACNVGHLAQHTFMKLLYQEAMSQKCEIRLSSSVKTVEWLPDCDMYQVVVDSGDTLHTKLVVAADGSNSLLRRLWKIDSKGTHSIQHLLNVHILLDKDQQPPPPSMLYAIYNEDVVAMMVRHSSNEYVLQIPYFPPYHAIDHKGVPEIVAKIMNTTSFEIKSIRPWTMSALVASDYYHKPTSSCTAAGVLVGDAAHVFPPAGGFGMNTGLQDVHNLAWRLAYWYKSGDSPSCLKTMLQHYQDDRQPVARRNAALSVRNYQRVLELAKACYLHNQHPELLTRLLHTLPFLSLSAKRSMFSSLLKTALQPLASLKNEANLYAQHVTHNIRRILQQGGGLPLLFPKYELGYCYGMRQEETSTSWREDSMGFVPKVQVGGIFPHVPVRLIGQDALNLQLDPAGSITTTDLPSQLQTNSDQCFVLLVQGQAKDIHYDFVDWARESLFVDIKLILVVDEEQRNGIRQSFSLLDVTGQLANLFKGTEVVLIRPDGHVAFVGVTSGDEKCGRLQDSLCNAVSR
jgi:2-polyprenyl-6-methoxyphenol hydroxylase-like FAD-dependent oxidoreductase